MLKICNLGHHLFDDGIDVTSTDKKIAIIKTSEQVACRKCWDKFNNDVSEMMKGFKK